MATGTSQAARVDDSEALDHGVRLGLVVYAVVHLIVAFTALRLAWGDGGGSASQQGAFAQLARRPFGQGMLLVVGGGFASLALWQALDVVRGHRDAEGARRVVKRAASGVRAMVYAVLGYSAVAMAVGGRGASSSGKGGTDHLTARLMSVPGGQVLVGMVGLGVVGVGGYLVYRGWTAGFTKRLDRQATSGDTRVPVLALGKVGYTGKGVALAAVGALFVAAAVQHRPKESGGLDVALHHLLRQPFGPFLLTGVALGLACYGLFCFVWARHLDR